MAMKPLAGRRVIDFSKVIAGPLCTQYLADLGAEVVKIETLDGGDDTRDWPPLREGTGAVFLSLNRNKKSLALDLKSPGAPEIVARLVAGADIVVESYAPAVKTRLGVGYEQLIRHRRDLIYCSISGFGQFGPLRDALGYDNILQAFTGMMAMNGEPGGGPARLPISPIDQSTGLNAAFGILAAVLQRDKTGAGTQLEVSLFETAVAMLGFTIQGYLESGREPVRVGSAHGSICPYQIFETQDRPVLLGIANDRLWRRFAGIVGRPELADDPRFVSNSDRVAHFAETVGLVQAIMRTHGAAYWVETLTAADVPCTLLNTLKDLVAHEHTQARGIIQHYDGAGSLQGIALPILFGGETRMIGTPPPAHGENGREVLAALGYGSAEIEAFVDSRTVGGTIA